MKKRVKLVGPGEDRDEDVAWELQWMYKMARLLDEYAEVSTPDQRQRIWAYFKNRYSEVVLDGVHRP